MGGRAALAYQVVSFKLISIAGLNAKRPPESGHFIYCLV
ncbi:hypothetical protein MRBBS_0445 [Marinobacter sp. BSs20148]|nr:hypothetical protein MRBBS_0445 [Marinobacter sp. BSs20148]